MADFELMILPVLNDLAQKIKRATYNFHLKRRMFDEKDSDYIMPDSMYPEYDCLHEDRKTRYQ